MPAAPLRDRDEGDPHSTASPNQDLRHSFISTGTAIHVVRETAAHRSLAVTALYANASDEARSAAAERLEIRVGNKAAPKLFWHRG